MRKGIATWQLRCFGVLLLPLWGCTPRTQDVPALGAIVEMASPAQGSAGEPNLALGRGDTVYLSWIEVLPDSSHALRFVTWKDQTLGEPRTIASGRNWFVNWADFPMIAALPDGTLAAHWLQRSDTGRYSYNVMLTISRDGGQTWSTPVQPHRDASRANTASCPCFRCRTSSAWFGWTAANTPPRRWPRATAPAA